MEFGFFPYSYLSELDLCATSVLCGDPITVQTMCIQSSSVSQMATRPKVGDDTTLEVCTYKMGGKEATPSRHLHLSRVHVGLQN